MIVVVIALDIIQVVYILYF